MGKKYYLIDSHGQFYLLANFERCKMLAYRFLMRVIVPSNGCCPGVSTHCIKVGNHIKIWKFVSVQIPKTVPSEIYYVNAWKVLEVQSIFMKVQLHNWKIATQDSRSIHGSQWLSSTVSKYNRYRRHFCFVPLIHCSFMWICGRYIEDFHSPLCDRCVPTLLLAIYCRMDFCVSVCVFEVHFCGLVLLCCLDRLFVSLLLKVKGHSDVQRASDWSIFEK